MKQRIITASVGIFILSLVLFFYQTAVLNIAVAIITLMVVLELLLAKRYITHSLLSVICLIFSIFVSCLTHLYFYRFLVPISLILLFLFLLLMLCQYPKVKFETVATSFLISIIIPIIFQMIIYLRDRYVDNAKVSIFYIMLALGSAWFCDSGAYFVGVCFGKTRLANDISPKKTVEGLFGGLVTSVCFGVVLSLCFGVMFYHQDLNLHISFLRLIIALPIAAILSVIGDLTASLIKRQCGIKDFGSIMPGHGGILDRFDSVLFTLPFYYFIDMFWPLVT